MFKRKKKFQIPVSAYEYRMILDALMSSREKLMAQGRYTDAVDDENGMGYNIVQPTEIVVFGIAWATDHEDGDVRTWLAADPS